MKLNVRVVFFCSLSFIFVTSYVILKPVIFRKDGMALTFVKSDSKSFTPNCIASLDILITDDNDLPPSSLSNGRSPENIFSDNHRFVADFVTLLVSC